MSLSDENKSLYDNLNPEPILLEKSGKTEVYLTTPTEFLPQRKVIIRKKYATDVSIWIGWSIISAGVLGVAAFVDESLFTVPGYRWVLHLLPITVWAVVFSAITLFMIIAWITHRAIFLRAALSLQIFTYLLWGISIFIHLFGPYQFNAFASPFQWWTTVVIASTMMKRSFFNKTVDK